MKIGTLIIVIFLTTASFIQAQKSNRSENSLLPTIPIGADAYLMWDKLPVQQIGARAYMRSTYDREGRNASADASHYLFANEENYNVSLDVLGKGVFYFFRANHWHGSPWHFVIDGRDNIVKETGTLDPVNAKKNLKTSEFIPSEPFPQPIAWTWGTTKGADLIWTPMSFEKSMRIAYSRTRYGTGYYIYKLYANDEQFSRPIHSWDINQKFDQSVVDLIGKAGSDIAPKDISTKQGKIKLDSETKVVEIIKKKSTVVRALKFSLPMDKAIDLELIHLKVTWDEREHPSIDAPLCLFFGAGTFYNREKKEFLVKGFPINIRYDYEHGKVELACYYPMPFFKSAKIELTGIAPSETEIEYEIRYEPWEVPASLSSYFHATYQDIPEPEIGIDLNFLDTKGIEGSEDWSGSFTGNTFIFSHDGYLASLEGDPRFFFDDSQSPQAYGTGTEEWGGGGDYWGGLNMTLPFAGHPCGTVKKEEAKHEKDLIESGYRFLWTDMMPFGKRAVIRFEHGAENLALSHYENVTYWYGLPAATLVLTDEINIGDIESEKSHHYLSPDASDVESISSRYEWGIDHFPALGWGHDSKMLPKTYFTEMAGTEVFPEQKKDGRYTQGTSEFTIEISPENVGLLLRRTLDYSFPNQTAEVYVADATAESPEFKLAGIWYLAGSNTCLYSDPGGELDKRLHRTKTSNRRFRDDEFLVPASLTQGMGKVKVKIKFVSNEQELFPGFPFPRQSAWSELDYQVYSYIIPDFN